MLNCGGMATMRFIFLASVCTFLVLPPIVAAAASVTTFEAFYRIEERDAHVGYAILRETRDSESKQKSILLYVNTIDRDFKSHEVFAHSRFDEHWNPLSSSYEEFVGDRREQVKMELTFKNKTYQKTETSGNTVRTVTDQLLAGEFLRPAVTHLFAQGNLAKGGAYSYRALFDKSGAHRSGTVQAVDQVEFRGQKILRLIDDFEMHVEEIWMLANGEVLFSRLPNVKVTSRLTTMKRAIGNLNLDEKKIKKFFGGTIPEGLKHTIAPLTDEQIERSFPAKISTQRLDIKRKLIPLTFR
jgi:hypothetical protein